MLLAVVFTFVVSTCAGAASPSNISVSAFDKFLFCFFVLYWELLQKIRVRLSPHKSRLTKYPSSFTVDNF